MLFMKKLLLLFVLSFSLLSCEEEVKFNNPSFQGLKDNVFWRASVAKAVIETDGTLSIQGLFATETLTLKVNSTAEQAYTLGVDDTNYVTYRKTSAEGSINFKTATNIGNGRIVVSEYDTVNNTVTGTFTFNAENTDNDPLFGPILNFQQGVFYKIPVTQAL
jgi:hypothetical protein